MIQRSFELLHNPEIFFKSSPHFHYHNLSGVKFSCGVLLLTIENLRKGIFFQYWFLNRGVLIAARVILTTVSHHRKSTFLEAAMYISNYFLYEVPIRSVCFLYFKVSFPPVTCILEHQRNWWLCSWFISLWHMNSGSCSRVVFLHNLYSQGSFIV